MITNNPEDFARALLNDRGKTRIEDVEELVGELGLSIREVNSTGFEGALIRVSQNRKAIIALKREIREPARRRFTIAHEIGHFVLPDHGQDECYCKSTTIESWKTHSIRKQEYEANRFASEILLPAKMLYPIVNEKNITFARIKSFAETFNTSLTATTVKCVEVTEETCAVVCGVSREVKWVAKSESFHYFIPNMRLGPDSLAGRLFESDSGRGLEGEVSASSWIDAGIDRNMKLWEEAIYMPYYDMTLSLLTI
jgi:Zn-dependent peptidase ImmA (M78 family)